MFTALQATYIFETKHYFWYHGSCLCCFCISQGQSHHVMSNEYCYALYALLTKTSSWSSTQNIRGLVTAHMLGCSCNTPCREWQGGQVKKKASAFCPREILWHLLLNM